MKGADKGTWIRLVLIGAMIACMPLAVSYGLKIRRNAWTQTKAIRFRGDVSNGFYWGHRANTDGLFYLYRVSFWPSRDRMDFINWIMPRFGSRL